MKTYVIFKHNLKIYSYNIISNMEIWEQIKFENLIYSNNYEISSFGNIRNLKTKRILKINNKINGYSDITLNGKTFKVHRLVALAFIDNPNNKPTVNHIDRNKHNNRVNNLEWATYSEQSLHSRPEVYNNNRVIWKIDVETNNKIKKYNTLKEAGLEMIGIKDAFKNISSCALGKTKTAYGFKWEYEKHNDIINEIWKPFTFEKMKSNNYYISNFGKIKNKDRILKPSIDNNGYYSFYNKSIHIIVATKFIENPNNYNIVNHKDGNKLNNNVDNLEWVTQQMNCVHAIHNQLRKNIKKVAQIKDNNIIRIFNSCMDASIELSVNCSSINKCCKGQLKTCGNEKLTFKYLDEFNNIINNTNINNTNIKNFLYRKPKKINVYDKNNILIEICNTITETSKKYKFNTKTIISHCDNKVKHTNLDYYFKYNFNT
jgi:NUMOD4 motif/HNH endonuclease